MKSPLNKPKAIPYRPKRSLLSWVDFLVILATVMVFGAVVAANNPHAKAQSHTTSALITDLPQQAAAPDAELSLIKAKIRLANGGPWS